MMTSVTGSSVEENEDNEPSDEVLDHFDSGNLTKITVFFTERSMISLDLAVSLTGYHKTDIINRAVQIYAFVEGELSDGDKLFIQKAGGNEFSELRFS
jgi:hypothetical protein